MNNRTRVLLAMLLMTMAVTGVFAGQGIGISAGAGGIMTGSFGGGLEGTVLGIKSTVKLPYSGGGGYLFLDTTYAEFSFGFLGSGGKTEATGAGIVSGMGDMSYVSLNFGLLAKYPLALTGNLRFFPVLGIEFQRMLSVKSGDTKVDSLGRESSDFNSFWFRAGAGLDLALTRNLYARLEALYGIRPANKFEKDVKDNSLFNLKTYPGHNFAAKIGMGYRF